jgi:hypothetical protein
VRRSEKVRTQLATPLALMSAAVRAGADIVLIQEQSMKKEENGWKAKIWDAKFIYIFMVPMITNHMY